MNNIFYIALFVLSVFASSVSQALLKRGANATKGKSVWRQYLNPLVLGAYALFFGCTLVTVFCYRVVPLSLGMVLESLGYIFVTTISVVALKEKVTPRKIVGNVLIVAGVVVFALAG